MSDCQADCVQDGPIRPLKAPRSIVSSYFQVAGEPDGTLEARVFTRCPCGCDRLVADPPVSVSTAPSRVVAPPPEPKPKESLTPEQRAERFKLAKNMAAAKALELYGSIVKAACEELDILLADLDGDAHVHMALCVQEGSAVVVRAQWTFHANPVVVEEMLEMAKARGLV